MRRTASEVADGRRGKERCCPSSCQSTRPPPRAVERDFLTQIKGEDAVLLRTVEDLGREVHVVAKRLSTPVRGGCEEREHPPKSGTAERTARRTKELRTSSKRRRGQFADVDADAKVHADTGRWELRPIQDVVAVAVESVACEETLFSLFLRTSPGAHGRASSDRSSRPTKLR